MIVSDANLLVYLFVRGQWTGRAEQVAARDPLWAAPFLWRSEFRNALAGLVRSRVLPMDQTLMIVEETERWMAGREYTVPSDQVLRLAASSGCSAYDCEYVALAQDLGVPLVTSDRQLLKAFPGTALAPATFAGRS